MTAGTLEHRGPANAISDEEGRRWYVFGEGDDAERFVSVTTALSVVQKEGLIRWATWESADAAFEELPKLARSLLRRECGNTYKRCQHDFRVRCVDCPCGECPTCMRKWIANRHYGITSRRAEEGTRVHDIVEHWVLNGGVVAPHGDDIAPYVAQFLAWVADYGLTPDAWEMAEATVINREYGYAGTLDAIVTFRADAGQLSAELVAKMLGITVSQATAEHRAVTVIVDLKSREKEEAKLYPEYALQEAGYRNGQVVRLRDGREIPMPATDGAVIVQVRPDGYLCRPVIADDTTFGAFLAVLNLARWYFEHATASVSSRSFKVPKEPEAPKPARAPRAAPAKKAAAPRKSAKRAGVAIQDVPEPTLPIDAPAARPVKSMSAIMQSVSRPLADPDPDSPYGDDIPF